jgi:hypothetical protein
LDCTQTVKGLSCAPGRNLQDRAPDVSTSSGLCAVKVPVGVLDKRHEPGV